MKKLVIISGLPGSGKSTLAKTLAPEHAICTTDDYPGLYTENADGTLEFHGMEPVGETIKLAVAHGWNLEKAVALMEAGEPVVVNANTNTQHWEFFGYLEAARANGYEFERIDLFDAGLSNEELMARGVHGAPEHIYIGMRERYQHGDTWMNESTENPFSVK